MSETPAIEDTPVEQAKAEFRKFIGEIHEKLGAGEKRLGIPGGTLSDLPNEPDYMMVIKIIAAIEPTVNDLIAGGLSKGGGLGGVPNKVLFAPVADFAADRLQLSGRAGKLELAQRLEMLDDEDVSFATAISVIRNRYAHNIKNASRQFIEMVQEGRKNDAQLSKKLFYGVDMKFDGMPNSFAKILLAWSFSRFLESADRRLHVPKGGSFLNGLLGLAIPETNANGTASDDSDSPVTPA